MAAAQGLTKAQNSLGTMYETGKGVAVDYGEAIKWYRKAADQGNPAAQANLGSLYLQEKGIQADDAKAYSLSLQAAKQGEITAIFNLGQMYEHGFHVSQDRIKAYAHYKLASMAGHQKHEMIMESLIGIKTHMSPAEIMAGEQEVKNLMREYGIEG